MTTTSKTIDSTRTRNGQEQENEQKEYKDTRRDYNYNNYPARARARDTDAVVVDLMPGREIMDQIATAYKENINPMITAAAAGIIERALQHGMEPQTVIQAIEETGMASRPSPYYLSAVLRNWAESGVVLSRSRGGADIHTTQARPWWR